MSTGHTGRSHSPGPWEARALGGCSTVICPGTPPYERPSYAYDESRGFCVGYPFIDEKQDTRGDFVCFEHKDARLIAAAPELLEACKRILAAPYGVALSDLQFLTDTVAKAEDRYYACGCGKTFVTVDYRNKHQETCNRTDESKVAP